MREYVVTLKHDAGTIRIRTAASSADKAIELVCAAELSPRSAVRSVEPYDEHRDPLRIVARGYVDLSKGGNES